MTSKRPPESLAMRVAGMLGLKRLRWSLRRLHCPVDEDALVLEVGAGGNPYPRADVLLDAAVASIERVEQALARDRPHVLGLCEELPFKDKAFDFIIASHVLEHTDRPERFLEELVRVGKAGYIETPDAWFEKMSPMVFHRLEVSESGGRLLIRKKPSWRPEEEIAAQHARKLAGSAPYERFVSDHPDLFHVRFYWDETVAYQVVNPEEDAAWPYPPEALGSPPAPPGLRARLRRQVLQSARRVFSSGRHPGLDVNGLLRCPTCHGEQLGFGKTEIRCGGCATGYPIEDGLPRLFPKRVDGFNRTTAAPGPPRS